MPDTTAARSAMRARRVIFLLLVAALVGALLLIVNAARSRIRTTPVYEPPVLAGQVVGCTAGFYAHRGSTLVLTRSEEHTSELQSRGHLVCRRLLEKKKKLTPRTSRPSTKRPLSLPRPILQRS